MSKTNKQSVVYIDGENFIHRAIELLGKSKKQGRKDIIGLNLVDFVRKIVRVDERLEIRYYTTRVRFSAVPKKSHDKLDDIVSFNSKWLSRIGSQGVSIVRAGILRSRETDPCPKCGKVLQYFVEKGVDVRIAVDMVTDSKNPNIESMYLLSSDLDLLPAVGLVKNNKKRVTYIASTIAVNRAMVASTSQTLTFTKRDLTEASHD